MIIKWNYKSAEGCAALYLADADVPIFYIEEGNDSLALSRDDLKKLVEMDRELEAKVLELKGREESNKNKVDKNPTPIFVTTEVFNPALLGACVRLKGYWYDIEFAGRANMLITEVSEAHIAVRDYQGYSYTLPKEAFEWPTPEEVQEGHTEPAVSLHVVSLN